MGSTMGGAGDCGCLVKRPQLLLYVVREFFSLCRK